MPIPQLLADAVARDAGRPYLTFYDQASGERVELSRATTANWVAKTGNLLQDSLGAELGSTVGIALPPHWQRAVWLLAAWQVGATVRFDPDGRADVAVIGPETLAAGLPDAADVVALSLRPLGGRFTDPLPAGVLDYNAEVLGHGDAFVPYDPPAPSTPALVLADRRTLTHSDCIEAGRRRAASWAGDQPPRVLTHGADPVGDAELLLAALAADGSIVLVTNPQAERVDVLATEERVTAFDDGAPAAP